MKRELGIVKINLKQSKTVYSIFIPIVILVFINYLTSMILLGTQDNITLAAGNYFYLLPLLMAIFIPVKNFSKLINLGGKRKDFFSSSIILYVFVTAIVTIISIALHFTIDPILLTKIKDVLDLLKVFGFIENGIIIAFFQMWAFLILCSCVVHTMTLIQGHWYGWLVDVLLITIISVFTPIASLRAVLIWFFNIIIFHDIAIVQISSCLILAIIIYFASLIPIKSKQI